MMMTFLAFFTGLIGIGSVCAEIACADDGGLIRLSRLVCIGGLIDITWFIGVNFRRKAVCRSKSDSYDCQYY